MDCLIGWLFSVGWLVGRLVGWLVSWCLCEGVGGEGGWFLIGWLVSVRGQVANPDQHPAGLHATAE